MQIDAADLPADAELDADVAVVGAGPAGIGLALELARAGHRVILIESGGDSFSAAAQRLGDTVGEDPAHAPMSLATRRQIGGASNLWGGRCVPFDPIDFQPREIVAGARWPVGYDELQAYFSRACELCVCGEAVFDAREIPNLAPHSLTPGWPGGDVHATALERWSLPTNFGRRYRAALRSSPLVTLVTKLTCIEVVCAPDRFSVAHLVGATMAGNHVTVRAARYVLACGGLESTRLLLASNRSHAGGIGNHSDHLGHWYIAHVSGCIAQIHFNSPPKQTIYDFERDPDGVYVRRRLTFAPELLIDHNLPNIAMWLENPELGDATHGSGILSLVYLLLSSPLGRILLPEAIRQGKIRTTRPASRRAHLANVVRDLRTTMKFAVKFGYRRFLQRGHKAPGVYVPSASNTYRLFYHSEHLPHYSSHVSLTSHRDALGMPRLRTRLRFQKEDVRGVLAAHEHLDRHLRRHGIGHLEYLHEDSERAVREQLGDGYHQAGTSRMSAHPEDGVLDADLAVHGFDDLFVASSSAFVTSGQANSTFMIVAFALRLADHLHGLLSGTRPDRRVQRHSPVGHTRARPTIGADRSRRSRSTAPRPSG
jgi:choline dehydrogenase-like flavoprotein